MGDAELLRQIYADIQVIKSNLENDYKALHGNGKPGLLADMEDAKRKICLLEARQSWWGSAIAGWISVIAWLVSTGVAFVALLVK